MTVNESWGARRRVRIGFDDLFAGRGTSAMEFRADVARLSGERVEIAGFLMPLEAHLPGPEVAHRHGVACEPSAYVLTDEPGVCPDCSPVPVPAVFVPEPGPSGMCAWRDHRAPGRRARLRIPGR